MTDATPTRESLRADLEATRTGYHDLLKSLSAEDMKKKSANPEWNVGQLMWHLAWGHDHVPGAVARARKGKNFSIPQGAFNFINPWLTRWGARRATPEKLAAHYDEGFNKIIAALDETPETELGNSAVFMGETRSAARHFETAVVHFKEHQVDILKGLGR
jgi:hypothetical protein